MACTHVRRSRQGVLYFRFVIPVDVRHVFGRAEFNLSLHERSKRAAELTVIKLTLAVKAAVANARECLPMTDTTPENRPFFSMLLEQQRNNFLREQNESDARADQLEQQVEAGKREREKLQGKLIDAMSRPLVAATPTGPGLDVAIAAFVKERTSKHAWSGKTHGMWATRLRYLTQWFGSGPVASITRDNLNRPVF